MTNFSFLADEWADAGESARRAEMYARTDPRTAAIHARSALEQLVRWLYDHDTQLRIPPSGHPNLSDLLRERSFQHTYGGLFARDLDLIRKIGNDAVHTPRPIPAEEAVACVKYLFRFGLFVVRSFAENPPEARAFDETLLPTHGPDPAGGAELARLRAEAERIGGEFERLRVAAEARDERIRQLEAELQHYRRVREANGPVPAPAVLTEAQTRDLYIDVLLREAGWNPAQLAPQRVPEYAIPGTALRADYVLWGDDARPLAVVEAKRARFDAEKGRLQARDYADALEAHFGQRPLIFYTNGFDTLLWDDAEGGYPPRPVHGFYSKAELERHIRRRPDRKPLSGQPLNRAIVDRHYQERAIRRVAEEFDARRRRALLVMATGTGKTRVAAALTELLSKADWVRRVLFLADRNALVTQAKGNFNEYLPGFPALDLTEEADDGSARLVFSTYPTMMNRIDADVRQGVRFYGVGHFDLVIIDEAHRSVYDKYGAVFEYFDALFLGLTATPKDETDRDTYHLFHCPPGQPTDAYEYQTAVAERFLSPVRPVELPLKYPGQGIRYADLSEDEKREWETKFYDPETGDVPAEIDAGAINEWLFNEDTVDKVLSALMQHGHRIEGGDKLGKTIVFARNHRHALFLKERFRRAYPQLPDTFAEVIDNEARNPQGLIRQFKVPEQWPQLAISVDMLDTGIDVPEVVNLVIFKPVFSAAKFWQMLGRGTRLSPNLFGPGQDKADCRVFDVCGTFAFFDLNPEGVRPGRAASLAEQLFNARAELAFLIEARALTDEFPLRETLTGLLQAQTGTLSRERFEVRMHLRTVEEFTPAERWASLSAADLAALRTHVAPLVVDPLQSDEFAKRFDLLMVRLQIATVRAEPSLTRQIDAVQNVAKGLKKKGNLPVVQAQRPLIDALLRDEFWQTASLSALEAVRVALRELVKLIDRGGKAPVYTDFEDAWLDTIVVGEFRQNYGDFSGMEDRLRTIVREHADNLTIRKLHRNEPITGDELDHLDSFLFAESGAETRDAYRQALGEKPLGVFIRSIVGLDLHAAKTAFAGFLSNGPLNPRQQKFIDELIDRLHKNGLVERAQLAARPFTDLHSQGVIGLFPKDYPRILGILEDVEGRAKTG